MPVGGGELHRNRIVVPDLRPDGLQKQHQERDPSPQHMQGMQPENDVEELPGTRTLHLDTRSIQLTEGQDL